MSLVDQGKELAGQIVREDVPHLREAVNEVVTNQHQERRSALGEIWATLKSIWDKITSSGLVKTITDAIKAFFQNTVGRITGLASNSERTPLLPTLPQAETRSTVLQDLPEAPEALQTTEKQQETN